VSTLGSVALKIDIRKAFDTLIWNSLVECLGRMIFSKQFLMLLRGIFASAKIYVLINGSSHGYFDCGRGVRQGDPMSPLLFCLAEEVLGL